MNRILVPTRSARSWRRLLADPKHWRTGYSAKALAHAWEDAKGFPTEVRRAFRQSDDAELRDPELLLAIPEYQTPLPGGTRPTYTDLFVLARSNASLITIAVEGKVAEEFGPLVEDWRRPASKGRQRRLAFLCDALGIRGVSPDRIRYQLLHRAAAAVLEAARFGARHAVLMVHSFSPKHAWYGDFEEFVEFMGGGVVRMGVVTHIKDLDGVRFHAAWVKGPPRYLTV